MTEHKPEVSEHVAQAKATRPGVGGGGDFAREDQFTIRDARTHVFGLEARQDIIRAREADKQLHATIMAGVHRAPTHSRARKSMPGISFLFAQRADLFAQRADSRQRERKRG